MTSRRRDTLKPITLAHIRRLYGFEPAELRVGDLQHLQDHRKARSKADFTARARRARFEESCFERIDVPCGHRTKLLGAVELPLLLCPHSASFTCARFGRTGGVPAVRSPQRLHVRLRSTSSFLYILPM